MRYRIKITTHINGSQLFNPQVKRWFGWITIDHDGKESMFDTELRDRQTAINRIDLHHNGNRKITTIEFEYINKD